MTRQHLWIGLFCLFFAGRVKAQYADIQYSTDTANYGVNFWRAAADSLSREWASATLIQDEPAFGTFLSPGEGRVRLSSYERDSLGLVINANVLRYYRLFTAKQKAAAIARAWFVHYAPSFYRQLQQRGMPRELAMLPFALSAMQAKVTGYTGASGLWFITYPFARKFGLQVDSYVDERRDIASATEAALSTLQLFYQIYGDWKLAVAAYLTGPPMLNKSIRRLNSTDYYALQSALPFFARDGVDAWTAAILMMKNKPLNTWVVKTIPCDTVEVSRRLHFVQLAEVLQLNSDELRYLNPRYKYDIIPAVNRVYILYLPQGYLEAFNTLEDSIYRYKDSSLFKLHKKVVLPPPPKGRTWARPYKEEQPDNTVAVYYTIKSGDNLGFVADWYDVRINQIEDWNNIYNPRRIQIGKKLKIYVPKQKAAFYRKINSLSFAQKQKLAGKPAGSAPSVKPKEEVLTKGFFWYTVKNGESPYTIARKYPGVSADDILRWNNIKDPRKIRPGQKLKIKKQ